MSVPSGFWLVTKMPTFIVFSPGTRTAWSTGIGIMGSNYPRIPADVLDKVGPAPSNGSTLAGQYRPPSLRWSQLTTFSGTILSTTRFGALASALGWTGDAL